MADSGRSRGAPQLPPWLSQRVLEWSIAALILVALIWVFERQASIVQGQSERMAVRVTIRVLRDALVVDRLLKGSRAAAGTDTPNPFALLESLPANFAGEIAASKVSTAAPGSWVFDPQCPCVGYRLMYPQWLEPAQLDDAIWFRVGTSAGDKRLAQQGEYRWLGQSLN